MFDSTIIDVAIGVIFVFFVASIIASAINELVAASMRWRSKELQKGLRALLGAPEQDPQRDRGSLYKKIIHNSLIRDLGKPSWLEEVSHRERGPSYIPTVTFGRALMDEVFPEADSETNLEKLRRQLKKQDFVPKEVKESLLSIMKDADGDVKEFRLGVEGWYDSLMDRVSGWYGRKVRWWLVLWGLLLAIALNIDVVAITDGLWTNETVREAVVAAAVDREANGEPLSAEAIAEEIQSLEELDIPIGWTTSEGADRIPDDFSGWAARILGWTIIAAATSFGAPFWFDLLGKVSNLRLAGKKPEPLEPATE
jgi:hypothetical protein